MRWLSDYGVRNSRVVFIGQRGDMKNSVVVCSGNNCPQSFHSYQYQLAYVQTVVVNVYTTLHKKYLPPVYLFLLWEVFRI